MAVFMMKSAKFRDQDGRTNSPGTLLRDDCRGSRRKYRM
jgi:hypothetical protein